ncbi:MAG: PEGA domain-containing protein [Polyangiales bacterium]
MPGEEGTGLHAFDDIDPVSTVSALNVMPEPQSAALRIEDDGDSDEDFEPTTAAPPPRRSTVPPLPRARAAGASSSLPPPPPRRAGASSLPPPPPRGGLGGRSVPPPPPVLARPEPAVGIAISDDPDEHDQDTKVVPNAFEHDPEFAPTTAAPLRDAPAIDAGFEAFDEPEESGNGRPIEEHADTTVAPQLRARSGGIDDTALLELSATTVATNIDMEWDEEEVETRLRDDAGVLDAPPLRPVLSASGGRPSPFPPPMPSVAPAPFGQPSPFAPQAGGFATDFGHAQEWESEEEAMTRVLPHDEAPADWARGRGQGVLGWLPRVDPRRLASSVATLVGEDARRAASSNVWAWGGFAAVALIAAAVAAWAWRAGSASATVTMVVEPKDAVVALDGHPLAGQTSPFTLQHVKPNADHVIEISRAGYTSQTQHISPKAGELLAMPRIDLIAERVDTGFTLTSLPAGATIFLDGHKLDEVTPVRVVDLAAGMHVVRLEYGTAYQPWETQVQVAGGQVIELPTAKLAPAAPGSAPAVAVVSAAAALRRDEPKPEAQHESASKSGSTSSHHHHAAPSQPAFTQTGFGQSGFGQPAAMAAPRPAKVVAPPAKPAPVAAGGGTLRINARPWAQVFVDGLMVGNTPLLNLPIAAGHHRVKLVNPQLGMKKTLSIDVRAGSVTTKIVQLD